MAKISRRQFIVGAAVAGTGACVCGLGGCATFTKVGDTPAISSNAYRIEHKSMQIDLRNVPELAKVGGSVKIIDAKLPQSIIIARTGEAEYAAVSLLCPHRSVEVEYQHADRQFRCASLGHSTFGEDGCLRKGFADKSLTKFDAKLDPSDKTRLIITLS